MANQVFHHFIPDQQNKVIYVLLTRVGESKPRLYAYPWNKDLLESLKKAEEKRGQTVKVVGEFKKEAITREDLVQKMIQLHDSGKIQIKA